MIAIDSGQIEAMVAQMRSTVSRMQNSPLDAATQAPQAVGGQSGVNFARALQGHLDHMAKLQNDSQQLQEKFTMGDASVSLSDVMISSQKASITLQATLQVRNKLVSAYHDIMNMQI